MKRKIFPLLVLPLILTACSAIAAGFRPNPTLTLIQVPQDVPTNTSVPTETPPSEPTVTPTLIPSPTVDPTPTWGLAGPGEVIAPILLYHHVDPENTNPRYNVMPDVFAAQMQALADWGYQTITATQLVDAILNGAPLPKRPIIITFDDGQYSVYEHAFPIMAQHGFFGVTYIVANRLKSYGFTGAPQLLEMIAAGWEVGSHSFTHSDLSLDHTIAYYEISGSKTTLEEALDQPVNTFAFPYGTYDEYLGSRVMKWGYTAGMGLGKGWTHDQYSLYYMQRIEVQGTYDLDTFASLLPWSDPIE